MELSKQHSAPGEKVAESERYGTKDRNTRATLDASEHTELQPLEAIEQGEERSDTDDEGSIDAQQPRKSKSLESSCKNTASLICCTTNGWANPLK